MRIAVDLEVKLVTITQAMIDGDELPPPEVTATRRGLFCWPHDGWHGSWSMENAHRLHAGDVLLCHRDLVMRVQPAPQPAQEVRE